MKDWTLIGTVIGISIILGLGICEQRYLENMTSIMIKDVEEAENIVKSGDIDTGIKKVQNIIKKWEKSETILGTMINHQDIYEISDALTEIESKLKDFFNSNNISANFALLKEYIINIEEGNEFTIHNVL